MFVDILYECTLYYNGLPPMYLLYLKQPFGDETAIKFLGNGNSAIYSFFLSNKMSLKYVSKLTRSKSGLLERFSMFFPIRKARFRRKRRLI